MIDDNDEIRQHGADERLADARLADARLADAVRALRAPVETDATRFDAAVLARLRRGQREHRWTGGWMAVAAVAAALLIAAGVRFTSTHNGAVRATAGTRLVHFQLDGVRATSVAVAGSFNGWNPQATPLHRSADGTWTAAVRLRPGRHVYQFVIDRSRWIPDPRSPRDPADDFGPPNSVITVLARGSGS